MKFSNLEASIPILKRYVRDDRCLVASPDRLHISIATPSSSDAERLIELGWKPSPVYAGIWDHSTIADESNANSPTTE